MWPQLAAFALGVWLTAAPDALGYSQPARENDHVVGPLAATVGLAAAFAATRPLRWLNLPLGLWQLVAPFFLGYAGPVETFNAVLVGAGLLALVPLRGATPAPLGGGWRMLWDPAADPVRTASTP